MEDLKIKATYEAIKKLSDLMDDDGQGVTGGLIEYLREMSCPLVTYMAQVLKEDGYVEVVRQGRSRIHFWNKTARPSMAMAGLILEKTRDMKKNYKQSKSVVETDSETGDVKIVKKDVTPAKPAAPTVTKLSVLEELLSDAETKYKALQLELGIQESLISLLKNKINAESTHTGSS